jgi:transcriptional regulator with XRE-family HTH domain
MDTEAALSHLVGARIAAGRAGLALSLDQLATRTGVSRAMISRIERGEVHASAVVLDKLCAGLGLTLSNLFARAAESPLLRRAEQPVWRDPQSSYLRREVAPSGTGSAVHIVEVEFPPGAEVTLGPAEHRVIEQHVWLLEGEMAITLGAITHALAPGDCLHMYPDRAGITFRNPGVTAARYAVILTLKAA